MDNCDRFVMFDNELINFVLVLTGLVILDEFGFDMPIDTNVKVFVINFECLKLEKSSFVKSTKNGSQIQRDLLGSTQLSIGF